MSPQSSMLAVTKFWVACMGLNASRNGRDEIVELVADAWDAAQFEREIERLAQDPEIVELWNGEES